MTKWNRTKEQTTINKTLHRNLRSSNRNTPNNGW